MSAAHLIRLRGPWDYELRQRDGLGTLPGGGRAQMPCDWSAILGADYVGRVRFRRYFNRPGRLDPHEQVWLIVESGAPLAAMLLNDQPLTFTPADASPTACEITGQLATRNELVIELTRDSTDSANWLDEVRLEIRS